MNSFPTTNARGLARSASRQRIEGRIQLLCWLLPVAILAGRNAVADTVYRSISPDGRVVYSDQPPSAGKVQRIYSFENLPASPVPESVRRYRQDLESGMKKRLASQATPVSGTQLYSASWCGYCRKAKAYLGEKGIPYQEVDIDTPEGAKAFALAGGGGGIPLLLSKGQRVQGFSTAAYDVLFGRSK